MSATDLVPLIYDFLLKSGFAKSAKTLKKDVGADLAGLIKQERKEDLVTIFQLYRKNMSAALTPAEDSSDSDSSDSEEESKPVAKKQKVATQADSDSDSSDSEEETKPAKAAPAKAADSDSDSSSDSDDEAPAAKAAPAKAADSDSDSSDSDDEAPAAKAAPTKAADSDSDSSSDSEDEKPAPKAAPAKAADSDSDSSSDSEDEKPAAKKQKVAPAKAADSDSDSSSDSEDEAPAAKKQKVTPAKAADSDSDSSSDSDEDTKKPTAKAAPQELDSDDEDAAASKLLSQGNAGISTTTVGGYSTKARKSNAPFQRVDPKLAEDLDIRMREQQPNCSTAWGNAANEVLGKVRGYGFRHEKNKRKRGSYKGGQMDMQVRSIKF